MITEKQFRLFISKVNHVKDDINHLLMLLGANNDINAIIQRMDELDGSIADLGDYIYKCYVDRGSNREQEPLNSNLIEH